MQVTPERNSQMEKKQFARIESVPRRIYECQTESQNVDHVMTDDDPWRIISTLMQSEEKFHSRQSGRPLCLSLLFNCTEFRLTISNIDMQIQQTILSRP